jgi:hypothetical protein
MVSFPQASPPKSCTHLSPPPYAPHAQPISFFLILPPAQYWVRSTDPYYSLTKENNIFQNVTVWVFLHCHIPASNLDPILQPPIFLQNVGNHLQDATELKFESHNPNEAHSSSSSREAVLAAKTVLREKTPFSSSPWQS